MDSERLQDTLEALNVAIAAQRTAELAYEAAEQRLQDARREEHKTVDEFQAARDAYEEALARYRAAVLGLPEPDMDAWMRGERIA